MTGTLIDCLDSAETAKLAISPEGLRSIFTQIEAELHHSEIYRRAMAGVRNSDGAAEGFQLLLKAVGREAIRLALRQFVKPARTNLTVVPAPEALPAPQESAEAIDNPFDGSLVASIAQFRDAKLSKAEAAPVARPAAAQPAAPSKLKSGSGEQRDAVLRQIGQELRHLRHIKSVSLEQLHNQTRIPMHQLKALEAGQVEHLPEDVYTRGFIRQAGNALGINGIELAASLPSPDAAKAVVPSWLRSSQSVNYLRPVHLYLGYVTLMAGAVGGLAWLTQNATSESSLAPLSLDPPETLSQSDARSELRVSPGSVSQSGAIAQPAVTAPENLSY